MHFRMSRGEKFQRLFQQFRSPALTFMVCLYIFICIPIHVCIHKVHKYIHIYIYMEMLSASRLRYWTPVTCDKSRPYHAQKCNPFTLQGHLSLAHDSPATPLDREMEMDRRPPSHTPYTSLRSPALGIPQQHPAQGSPALWLFWDCPMRAGTEKSQKGDRLAVTWVIQLSGRSHWTQGAPPTPTPNPLFSLLSLGERPPQVGRTRLTSPRAGVNKQLSHPHPPALGLKQIYMFG